MMNGAIQDHSMKANVSLCACYVYLNFTFNCVCICIASYCIVEEPPAISGLNLRRNHAWQRPPAQKFSVAMELVGKYDSPIYAKNIEGPGIYYVGIIDMLQRWDINKKVEQFVKTKLLCKHWKGLSCVEPGFYRKRFLRQMLHIGIRPIQ